MSILRFKEGKVEMHTRIANNAIRLIGKEFQTNNYGKCVVTEYEGIRNVTVRFFEPHCIVRCDLGQLKAGNVKNPMYPSVFGNGYMGVGKYTSKNCGKAYRIWVGILERTCSDSVHPKHVTYKDVSVYNEWLNFQVFAEWCSNQQFFNKKDDEGRPYQLDKDILVKGNKEYSPETCCFVPQEVNKLLLNGGKSRGKHPVGVCYLKQKRKFKAAVKYYGKPKHLGLYSTPEEAFEAYKVNKELHIKELANKWKGSVCDQTYEALMTWEINICD